MTKRLGTCLAAAAMLAIPLWTGGCGKSGEPTAAVAESLLPPALFGTVEGVALGVAEARETAQDGDQLVLRGWIGGRVEPFVENRAIFLLVDDSLPLCQDTCKTPWDLCCSPGEKIRANTVTVQIADEAGQPLRASLRGQGGLSPAAGVVVAGTVRRDGDALFLVNAERIAVQSQTGAATCATGCPH